MRIISKEHDYYDGMARTGIDTETIYLRKRHEREVVVQNEAHERGGMKEGVREIMEILLIARLGPQTRKTRESMHQALRRRRWTNRHEGTIELTSTRVDITPRVACAGNETRAVIGLKQQWSRGKWNEHDEATWCGSSDEVLEFAGRLPKHDAKELKLWLEETAGGWQYSSSRTRAQVLDEHEAQKTMGCALRTVSAKPVIIVNEYKIGRGKETGKLLLEIEEDGVLRECGGPKLWKAEQAYQAISQYVATQTRGEPDMATVPDENLAKQKGFDKWSFRNEPGRSKHRTRRERALAR